MRQLSLGLEILPQIPPTSTYDPYWDEITQQDDCVSGQPLNPESQIENTVDGEESKLSKQFPTIAVGSRIRDISPLCPHDKEGKVLEVHSTWCEVLWDGWGSSSHHCLSDLELAPQQVSPCETVSGQVNNHTAHQLVFTDKPVSGQVNNHTNGFAHQLNGWIEKYSVPKNGHKYYYWRFAWREGTKKRRKYIGSCTNPHVKERVRELRNAIALGKNFSGILEQNIRVNA